jgi:hypothetical protein
LAAITFEAEMYFEAGEAFKKLIPLKPTHDMASAGLFHSLWEQKRFDEAFEEMKRFVKTADKSRHKKQIKEYMEIVREINERSYENEGT